MALEIQVEPTPNPNAMKFTLNQPVTTKSVSVTSREAATAYPLADRLFAIPGVKGLYMLNNFISVTKEPSVQWAPLIPQIQAVLTAHFSSS